MIWIGLDAHKRFSRMGCFDPASGEVGDLGSVSNDAWALEEALEELPSPKTVVLEAGGSSYYMAGLLESMAQQVWIVDPGAGVISSWDPCSLALTGPVLYGGLPLSRRANPRGSIQNLRLLDPPSRAA